MFDIATVECGYNMERKKAINLQKLVGFFPPCDYDYYKTWFVNFYYFLFVCVTQTHTDTVCL